MTKLIHIFILILFFSCNGEERKQTFSLPDINDIDEIIETVVIKDSFGVWIDNRPPDTIHSKGLPDCTISYGNPPLSVDLRKIKVTISGSKLTSDDNTVQMRHLISSNVNGKNILDKSDSLYFLFQNDTLKQLHINKKILNNLTLTSEEEESNKRKSNPFHNYYDLTIPIFSQDNKKAYVEVSDHFSGVRALYLEKINREWKIIYKQQILIY